MSSSLASKAAVDPVDRECRAPLVKSPPATTRRPRRGSPHANLIAHGESIVWLTGGGLAIALLMVLGLLGTIAFQGLSTFWPVPVERLELFDGAVRMGEATRDETYYPSAAVLKEFKDELAAVVRARQPDIAPAELAATTDTLYAEATAGLDAAGGQAVRHSLRTGNFELTNTHFHWVDDFAIARQDFPDWATVCERLEKGRFYGVLEALLTDGAETTADPAAAWAGFNELHPDARRRWQERRELEKHALGEVSRKYDAARLAIISAELDHGAKSEEYAAAQAKFEQTRSWANGENGRIGEEISRLDSENARYALRFRTADGRSTTLAIGDIVRAYPANQLSLADKWGVYLDRWREFLLDEPRNVNTEGGVFPAIWGTVAMTLIMSVLVAPFGVLAALYLREYARSGPIVSAVRIAINNLAGVPSIVFGVFGLGFFCYVLGGGIDRLFFAASLADGAKPTFGAGGLLWASLTLALLTLPVVIVATEEALAATPNSMREGSYACGASKWQTIRRIVLPRALPGMMTGTILAMARGAGEVAPLMLVGVVKLAHDLPVDGVFPYVHAQRSFMHLGFHVYDLGFQSPNSQAAKPMVFTTALLLVALIALLNVTAIVLRNRLRRKFVTTQF